MHQNASQSINFLKIPGGGRACHQTPLDLCGLCTHIFTTLLYFSGDNPGYIQGSFMISTQDPLMILGKKCFTIWCDLAMASYKYHC